MPFEAGGVEAVNPQDVVDESIRVAITIVQITQFGRSLIDVNIADKRHGDILPGISFNPPMPGNDTLG